ncbi:hypothetical protein OsJ_08201 [Oryza sativa Japonica Group]|uniref:Uncharacterized protein n=1 Tax=Oryza sativa subsp. japonica TaxID=39947 RepID=B9F2G4_ORYSJ|nr:hypothetical protein OsJ_08201 [Oryza sativa Japonica Group]
MTSSSIPLLRWSSSGGDDALSKRLWRCPSPTVSSGGGGALLGVSKGGSGGEFGFPGSVQSTTGFNPVLLSSLRQPPFPATGKTSSQLGPGVGGGWSRFCGGGNDSDELVAVGGHARGPLFGMNF